MGWPKGKKREGELRKFIVNDNFFDKIDTEESAYMLGFLCADGYLTKRDHNQIGVDVDIKDRYILEYFKEFIKYSGAIKHTRKTMVRLKWTSCKHVSMLKSFGFDTNKSHSLKPILNVIDPSVIHHFVRGYIDGDGCIFMSSTGRRSKKKYLYLSLRSTPAFCHWINSVLPVPINYRYSVTGVLYTKKISSVLTICEWLYKDANFFLKRKYDAFNDARVDLKSSLIKLDPQRWETDCKQDNRAAVTTKHED
jgi:hypothetical protein